MEKTRSRGFPVKGQLLRELRKARGWSQEEAAHRAGVSDKVIRKAESGGRLDALNVAVLADLYGSPERPLVAADLLAESQVPFTEPAARDTTADAAILVDWLTSIWNRRCLETIDQMCNPSIQFHCELGVLSSPSAVRVRVEEIWHNFDDFEAAFERTDVVNRVVICRWRMTMTQTGSWHEVQPSRQRVTRHITTSARMADGKITKCWEFWESHSPYQAIMRAPARQY